MDAFQSPWNVFINSIPSLPKNETPSGISKTFKLFTKTIFPSTPQISFQSVTKNFNHCKTKQLMVSEINS